MVLNCSNVLRQLKRRSTTADKYVIAPAVVFQDVFHKHGVPITMAEARLPMGLRKDLHIPHKLSEVANIKESEIEKLSQMALNDPSTPGNPKKLTLEDMKLLYKYSLEGKLF